MIAVNIVCVGGGSTLDRVKDSYNFKFKVIMLNINHILPVTYRSPSFLKVLIITQQYTFMFNCYFFPV